MPQPPSITQQRALDALTGRRFFKLICGGSFTDSDKVENLARVYSKAGIDCIDIAPDRAVLAAVEAGLAGIPEPPLERPLIMVSIPLDPDPHFRKIDLIEPDCILCGECVPVCPTDAIALNEGLEISQPACYGCGRCVDACPTEALVLHPFQQDMDTLSAVLGYPLVEAVEIHTGYADPYMLPDFLNRVGPLLSGKAIALCFRPDSVPVERWLPFLIELDAFVTEHSPLPLIIQIDGAPMSGSDDPAASLPALKAAVLFRDLAGDRFPVITLSGGINAHTADFLKDPEYAFIAGVGMGTVARRHVWDALETPQADQGAVARAAGLVRPFQNPRASGIIGAG